MKNLRLFKTKDEFMAVQNSLPLPNVSAIRENDEVIFLKKEIEQYAKFTAKYKITQDIINNAENGEISLIQLPIGYLKSYEINGELYEFEEPQYEIVEKEITYVETSMEGINYYGISKDSCIESGKGLFNTEMTWTINREIDLDNDFLCMSMTNGEMYQPQCVSLKGIAESIITLHSDNNKSFSLTQMACYEFNSSEYEGAFIGFSIVESSCVTIVDEYSGIGIITSQPSTVTTYNGMTLLNEDKVSPNMITVSCTQDDLDKEYIVEYTLNKSNNNIDYGAFGNCYSLTSIEITNSVTSIGSYAFGGCGSLTSVTIGSGVTSISSSAFTYCDNLTEIVIPDSVTSISDSAFYSCDNLTSINIPDSVTSIGEYAFSECSGLTSIVVSEGNTVYDSRENCNAIIKTSTNTLIQGCKNTVIPNSVTSIGNSAFYGCRSLTLIIIPNSVTSIGDRTFYNCNDLTSIIIPDSVTSIGDSAFQYCNSFTEIVIPDSVKVIGEYAFFNCHQLTSVAIGDSVTSIGDNAFHACYRLTSVTIPDSVTSIGYETFSNCSSLTSIIVSENNQYYDSRENCNAIIKTSTNELVLGCKNTIILDSVTSIGDYAFSECSGLTSIVIPDSVTSIGNWAFSYCEGATSVTIGSGVTNIGSNAFFDCDSLTSIIIPDSVTSIGDEAFRACYSLTSIICNAVTAPTILSNTFSDIANNGVLKYPKGSDYSSWMSTDSYYLGYYNWTSQEIE